MRLIDADALKSKSELVAPSVYAVPYRAVSVDEIESSPTIEAEPVRHGRWVCQSASYSFSDYRCSECGAAVMTNAVYTIDNFHYCHRCGAKMDGKEGETE